jgi:acetoin utilization deacetylase AcuC-like enzyme
MVSDSHIVSPSAIKPKLFVDLLKESPYKDIIEIVEPEPVSVDDIKRCHESNFVDDVLSLKRDNGFGTRSQSVVDSLPYTNGAMYTGAKLAIQNRVPVCAPVSGFHHAGYDGWYGLGYFCTFNGLVIAGEKLIHDKLCQKVAIIDCDMHFGNGTEHILPCIDLEEKKYLHLTFGKYFFNPLQCKEYMMYFDTVERRMRTFLPDVIMYQAGADVHISDPFGGVLNQDQMYERDITMFSIAKDLNIPIVWNLAGGYQKDADGGCSYVLKLHENTLKACKEVYGVNSNGKDPDCKGN